MKYIRLFRLQDQYIQIGSIIAGAISIHLRSWYVVWWIVACTCLSIAAFILNEFTDRDTDAESWNPAHSYMSHASFNMGVVWSLFAFWTVIGLYLSSRLGLLWWAIAGYLIAVFYSLKPVRLKGVYIIDEVAQMLAVIVLPFLAILWRTANHDLALAFIITSSLLIWSAFFPYEIADYAADKKAGLKNTHVVLGVRNSLRLGLVVEGIGLLLYGLFAIYHWALWTVPALPVLVVVAGMYIWWLRMDSDEKVLHSIQKTMRVYKPLTMLFIPYLVIVLFLV